MDSCGRCGRRVFSCGLLADGFLRPRQQQADSADNNERSPVLLYENDVQLGPAHSTHVDVARLGKGRFSHWRNVGVVFIFSSSDDSNPMTNGRTYSAVMPDLAPPAPK